ncbi:MAG: MG2 domain-containing protein [Planctomycetia bacterium]|nr:MG2 domain-containing protein [Planctomycetia bacterium]
MLRQFKFCGTLILFFFFFMGIQKLEINAMDVTPVVSGSVMENEKITKNVEIKVESLKKLQKDGKFAEALYACEQLLFGEDKENPKSNTELLKSGENAQEVRECLICYINCLRRLGKFSDVDAFLEKVAATYADHWEVLECVADIYTRELTSHGCVVSGVFQRGRYQGMRANSVDRDRVRAMQLLNLCAPQVLRLAESDLLDDQARAGWFFIRYADFLMHVRERNTAWKLQNLTDVHSLPDYNTHSPFGFSETQGAPVDENDNPIFYALPSAKEKKDVPENEKIAFIQVLSGAQNDGELWRWCLEMAVTIQKNDFLQNAFRVERDFRMATFAQQQFGVQTLAEYGFPFAEDDNALEAEKQKGGILSIHTLKDNETLAKLATGVKRFTLPDDYNYINLYESIADSTTHRKFTALNTLATIMQNRRQYPRAAEYLKRILDESKLGNAPTENEAYLSFSEMAKYFRYNLDDRVNLTSVKKQYEQIVKNWGRFEGESEKTPGANHFVFRFRNATKVNFTATKIAIDQLFVDMEKVYKEMEENSPLSFQEMNQKKRDLQDIHIIGYDLVHNNKRKYLTDEVVTWSRELEPAEGHFDRVVDVETPLKNVGAYFIEASVEDGNRTAIVMWVSDLVLIQKNTNRAKWYYVADSVTGKAVPGAKLHIFGQHQEFFTEKSAGKNINKIKINTKTLDVTTDENGQWIGTEEKMPNHFQWMIIAQYPNAEKGKDHCLGFLGFQHFWYEHNVNEIFSNEIFNQVKVFPITDRPVYRPDQKVHYKFWINTAKYDQQGKSPFAGETFQLELHTPRGEKIDLPAVTADAWGGCAGEYLIPADATLGQYLIHLRDTSQKNIFGSLTFRIEEYKKPEFEVTVNAPKDPVMLGDKINATIEAKYYFGAPVTQGTIKYKVTRVAHSQRWFAPAPWDWFYGPGYWWNAYDYEWFPGWRTWGCERPLPAWFHVHSGPPEVILEKEIKLGENCPDMTEPGVFRVEFDTIIAKELHSDTDHQYTITAEVVDESRRTITGTGRVLVARKPFRVYTWTNRAYYRVGDDMTANFHARTLDGKPVTGDGVFKLFRVTYDENGTPAEKELFTQNVQVNPEGMLQQKLTLRQPGQFRVSYTLTDKAGHTAEGGQIFTVLGEKSTGENLRFNALELIPDKGEYAPGETVKLMVNTDLAGATVILFMRACNGICLDPVTLKMEGKSTVVDVPVRMADMPNFFVEAVTVAAGTVYSISKEICVPPAERVLNMEILPEKTEYLPGQEAKAKIKLTTLDGKPYVGSTVVTIYDKSLEYISGGSNIPEIKAFFWKWRRQHFPQTNFSSGKYSNCLVPKNEERMNLLGIFGSVTQNVTFAANGPRKLAGMGTSLEGDGAMQKNAIVADSMPMAEMTAEAGAEVPMMAPDMDMGARNTDSLLQETASTQEVASPSFVEPQVRSHFADTALWISSLETDEDGTAEIRLNMPENLTTWKILSWAMGDGTCVGSASAEVITRKNLILRMQTPRFLVTSDEILLTANVHNYLPTEKDVTVTLELPDATLIKVLSEPTRTVKIAANGEARIDWRVRAENEGECVVRMKALTTEESDAVEMTVPINIHGMKKQLAFSGMISASAEEKDARGTMRFDIPAQRRVNESELQVRFSPTLAGAMIDALPYLTDYPYGCTEQTLNRFLPTVLTQKSIIEMGVDLEDVKNKTANLNAQEIGDAKERAAQWSRNHVKPRGQKKRNPVFDKLEVDKMAAEGVSRLASMQCSDGGWGWFSGTMERSTPHLTALVTRGLILAQQNDVAVEQAFIDKGIAWLQRYQNQELQKLVRGQEKEPKLPYKRSADNMDALVYMVLAEAGHKPGNRKDTREMGEWLYKDRLNLSRYSQAMIGVAFALQNESEKLKMVVENLSQFLVVDPENQTAFMDLGSDSCWWFWHGNSIETQAAYLRLLCMIPSDWELTVRAKPLVPRVAEENLDGKVIPAIRTKLTADEEELLTYRPMELAPKLVKYLLNNRKNAIYWESTRDTANVLEAMAQYLKISGEMNPEMTVEIWVNGEMKKAVEITKDNLFTVDNTFTLTGNALKTGAYEIQLRRKGAGPLYYNAYFTYFSLEDFITKAGLEIKVDRKYYKLVRVEGERAETALSTARGQVNTVKVEKYDRIPLAVGATVTSGDLIEVELSMESKNDYTYLMFEDPKPAGFEPVDIRSGYNGNALGAYVEYRDNRVVFFVQKLAKGKHSVSYQIRAEQPGSVSALPTRGEAMYAPELRANSDEMKIQTLDKE